MKVGPIRAAAVAAAILVVSTALPAAPPAPY